MQRWFSHKIHQLSGTTGKLVLLLSGLLILWGILAPITTIVWWLNQTTDSLSLEEQKKKPERLRQVSVNRSPSKIDCYIVFLPGIGNFSPDAITVGQRYFIDQLADRHSNCVAVRDVFAYSVNNTSLGNQGVFSALWKASKNSDGFLNHVLIHVRNLWRFAISADDRYGPVYNLGIAHTIVERMNAAYPIDRSNPRVNLILLSTSGGTQVALGATNHLRNWIPNARITVVSIGGAFDGRAGFNEANHVYHLYGSKDWVTVLPHIVFPARWRFIVGSPVNQARQQERYTVCDIGDQKHNGANGYFGENIAFDHTSYVKQTLEQVSQLPIWSLNQPLTSQCPEGLSRSSLLKLVPNQPAASM